MDLPRLSTGYHYTDQLIEGGLPQGTVTIYSGGNGLHKLEAGAKFISSGINTGENCLIITTKYTPDQYKMLTDKIGIDLSAAIFLDAVSWRLKRVNPTMKSQSDYEINNLSDLNAILSTVMKICNGPDRIARIFFDTPSSILLYSTPGPEQVYKFVELLTAFIRNSDITMIMALDDQIHDKKVVNSLLFLVDGHCTIDIRTDQIELVPEFLIFTDLNS